MSHTANSDGWAEPHDEQLSLLLGAALQAERATKRRWLAAVRFIEHLTEHDRELAAGLAAELEKLAELDRKAAVADDRLVRLIGPAISLLDVPSLSTEAPATPATSPSRSPTSSRRSHLPDFVELWPASASSLRETSW